ncbi:MAG TPA: aldo/keto reductase [Lentisphaeria bacterium]|nr:aldo/keto reductase [Lentisphaeria bacterium]
MHYRRFGRTNLEMSVLSCGGMRFQQSWKDLPATEVTDEEQERLESTVRRALGIGINHIETAHGYGSSESQLGRILPKLPREKIILQTKVPPSPDGGEFRKLVETSLTRLDQSHVDLLGFHGINNQEILDFSLKPGGPLAEARKMQDEGMVKFIGFSTHGPTDSIVSTINTGEFDYVNLHWYYFDQANAPAIDAAREQDMGCFIISPNDKGGRLYDPPPKLARLCKPLTPMGMNALFCLSRPDVHTLSHGAARPSDFDACLDYLPLVDSAWESVFPVLKALTAEGRRVLGKTWHDSWWQDLPSIEETPGQVNVYHVLRLYNMWKAFDMLEYAKGRYNLMGNPSHWFPGNQIQPEEVGELAAALQDLPIGPQAEQALRDVHDALKAEDAKRQSKS